MFALIAVMAWYGNSSKRDKILCTLRRANKTKINKWVKMQTRDVIIAGGKYHVIPSCITFLWYNAGLIHMLFPQWVATLDFSEHNPFPHDPNDMKFNADTPQIRNALNKTEWTESYFKGSKPSQSKTKTGLITQYLPWVAILLVVGVAFYFNSKMTGFGATLDAVINKLNTIAR
jgi:hypothetical protein